jgi:hypothetical protein
MKIFLTELIVIALWGGGLVLTLAAAAWIVATTEDSGTDPKSEAQRVQEFLKEFHCHGSE